MGNSLFNQPKHVLEKIIQNALDAFVVIDARSRVVAWTAQAEALFGWSAAEAVNRRITELIIPVDLREAHDRGMARYFETGAQTVIGRRVEVKAQRKDGEIFPVELSITRIENDGAPLFSAALRDITQRHQHELALNEAGRMKDEFLAMLAHELRNPLAPISTAASLLQIGSLDATRMAAAGAVIARQVAHMMDLVDDLLDVSRVTRGLITIDKKPIELGAVITDAVEQVSALITERGHSLSVQPLPESVHVLGDRTRLVQVLVNLLSNAARYTPNGGDIALTAEIDEQQVEIAVGDSGIGIAHDVLPYVFDLFVQGRRSPDRGQGGLGLGLALVRNLVEHHGGTVSAKSEGPGKGSEFRVRLPRHHLVPEFATDQQGKDANQKSSAPLRCLIVDDNADAAQMLAILLELHGHQVSVEHTGTLGLARARSDRPQLLLLDIGLPDMDGYELARRLREIPDIAGALIVAVTGYGQAQDLEQSKAAGFDYHLLKPVEMEKLLSLTARART